MDINWTDLRSLNGSQRIGFEELCCQLARHIEMPENSEFYRIGTPDGGVECYWQLPDGNEYGWQAKFFREPPKNTQWKQITKSIKRALDTHPNLKKMTICLPQDRADPRIPDKDYFMDKWNENVKKWKNLAVKKGITFEFEYWGESEIWDLLSQEEHRGRYYFWFNREIFTKNWFENHLKEVLANVGPRYSPDLDIGLPIVRIFDGLGHTSEFFKNIKDFYITLKKEYKNNQNSSLFSSQIINSNINKFREDTLRIIELMGEIEESNITEEYFKEIIQISSNCKEFIRKYIKRIRKLIFTIRERRNYKNTTHLNKILITSQKIFDVFDEVFNFFSDNIGKLALNSRLLLIGEAGVGKTHLFCDIAKSRLENNLYTILLLGEHFLNRNPWEQIISIIGLDCTRDIFLQALDSLAELMNSKFLILIDALNEGDGTVLWPSYLPGILEVLSNYEGIALGISIRKCYEKIIIPQTISEKLIRVEHEGFTDFNYRILTKFLNHYKIDEPTVPLLLPAFKNPLFLKIYCQGLQYSGLRTISTGHQGFTKIFNLFIDSIYARISSAKMLDSDPEINYIKIAIDKIVESMIEQEKFYLERSLASKIINEVIPGDRTYEKSLFRHMISEGILKESYFYQENGSGINIVQFSYERFTDFIIGSHLIEKHFDDENPKKSFEENTILGDILKNSFYNRDMGLIDSFSLLFPEKYNRELIEIIPEGEIYTYIVESFIQSLIWRDSNSIFDTTLKIINSIVLNDEYLYERLIKVLLMIGPIANNKLNAYFLQDYLKKLGLAERDKNWTFYLNNRPYLQGYIEELINWTWFFKNKNEMDDENVILLGIILTWFLCLTNLKLRDRSTKALISLFTPHINLLSYFISEFHDINDPYILERVFAVIYGCCLRSEDDDSIKLIAEDIYLKVFKERSPYPHLLFRDYAREIIELALSRKLLDDIDLDKIRPPYESDIQELLHPDTWRSSIIGKKSLDDYSSISFSIYHWDFGRYIIGTNSQSFPWVNRLLEEENQAINFLREDKFDLSLVQDWIFKRVLELGWNPSLFKDYDDLIKRHYSNYEFIERIGKKYQMIAYYEICAVISDNYKFINDKMYLDEVGSYSGPWQISHGRDIDPSCLIEYQEEDIYKKTDDLWWYPFIKNKWKLNMEHQEWLGEISDLPNYKDFIELINPNDKTKWLVLQSLFKWIEQKPKDEINEDNNTNKMIWTKVRSYLVRKDKFKEIIEELKDENFMNNWMPECHHPENIYLGEFYWAPSFLDKEIPYFGRFDWVYPRADISILILPTFDDYFHTSSGRDSSFVSLSINITMLHKWIVEKMNLDWKIAKKGFYNKNNELIAYDPSYNRDEPKSLIIKRKKLLKFLKSNDLEIIWIIYGNKHIMGISFEENKDIRYDINGFFWLDKDKNKVNGSFYLKNIIYDNLRKIMEQYLNKTKKNAIWRDRITKQFKKWYLKTTNKIL